MRFSLKTKLIIVFTSIIVMTGFITALIGTFLIQKGIMNLVEGRVRNDLGAAWELCNHRLALIKNTVYLAALRHTLKVALEQRDRDTLKICLEEFKAAGEIEILTVTDERGNVILRSSNPGTFGDNQSRDQLVKKVLEQKRMVASPVIVSRSELAKEGSEFARRAHIQFIPTPRAKIRLEQEETSGLVLKVAVPIWGRDGTLIGVLYGGDLINRNYRLVDKIKNTVYKGEVYEGLDMGTTTVFQRDLRISTNVMTSSGERAIGTRVSEEVYDRVLVEGKPWVGRAFVVNAWYVTAYEPMRDIDSNIIGMLYVGLLEKKFVDMEKKALLTFFGVTILGMILVLIVANFIADTIIKPLKNLAAVSKKLSDGNFFQQVTVQSGGELGDLEKAFNAMILALKERDRELRQQTQEQLMRSEKFAALGRMAAGIAHEVNNPLTGVLMYSHLLLKSLPEGSTGRKDVEVIVSETKRCRELLKNLLNFSRESEPHKKPSLINDIVEVVISLISNNVYFEKVALVKDLAGNLPEIMVDANQIEQVLMNLAMNAAEAINDGGKIIMHTRLSEDGTQIITQVTDTGCGISEENLHKIFDPFFTTKEVGKGTGLGLAVSYGIIKRHGGQISVESRVGSGTTFTIMLPVEFYGQSQKGSEI